MKRRNYSWDPVKLFENYTEQELSDWIGEIWADPSSKDEARSVGNLILTKKAQKQTESLAWAVTYHIKARRKSQ